MKIKHAGQNLILVKFGLLLINFFHPISAIASQMSTDQTIYDEAINHPLRPAADQSKDQSRKPAVILPFSKIIAGNKVLEIGAGGGYTTELISRVVGSKGHVYAETLSSGRIANGRLSNVTALRRHKLYQLPDVLLENGVKEGEIDAVIIFFALHDIMMNSRIDQVDFMANVFSLLKPGGYFVVLDNAALPDSGISDTRRLHRIGENYVKQKIISAGFKFDKASPILRNPDDDLSQSWRSIKGNQDRFAFRFLKPIGK